MIEKISETDKSIVLCDKISLSLIFNDMSGLTKYGSDKQRFWLKFYSIEASEEGIVLDVFLSLDDCVKQDFMVENHVDSIALFGVKKIVKEHGVGIDYSIDVSKFIYNKINLKNIKHLNNFFFNISISNRKMLNANNKITIEKISILKEIII
ncbi:DUF7868 domain-containing protein [Acinetobacter modestus]|uniref:DUF7868 domain-containing protein n=1 Tax=Acinetobacter modestus TaxID=1776740 RepID=A0ABP2TWC2_9GAMM|nr:hypothetical protein [Acinetobacter modestus]ENU26577.1 hypothetical protein F992_02125 [Acinetobacter modestus]GGA09809.1 hypothetical protein GCM10017554_02030 [Acinetobacter modestus]